MKRQLLFTACMAFAIGAMSQTKETRNVQGYHSLDVSSAIQVVLKMDGTESLVLEAEPDVLKNLKTEVSGGELKIHIVGDTKSNGPIKAYLSAKQLDKIECSGASGITCKEQLKAGKIELDAKGACSMDLIIDTEMLDADVDGACKVVLKGRVGKMEAELSGASHLYAEHLTGDEVSVKAVGASDAKIHVNQSLKARASGASRIKYTGEPKQKEIDVKDASTVDAG